MDLEFFNVYASPYLGYGKDRKGLWNQIHTEVSSGESCFILGDFNSQMYEKVVGKLTAIKKKLLENVVD